MNMFVGATPPEEFVSESERRTRASSIATIHRQLAQHAQAAAHDALAAHPSFVLLETGSFRCERLVCRRIDKTRQALVSRRASG